MHHIKSTNYIKKLTKRKKKKGEFDDVFRYEPDDENWRLTYILP
jgi:DNA-directed RNA polymerase II subunit RPB1